MNTLRYWVMWLLAASFFLAEYFARVAPSVMVPDLMNAFNVDAFQLAVLTVAFYYSYIVMQIPVGTLLDVFGTRYLLSVGSLICGIASFCFVFSHSVLVGAICRFAMGFSAAFAMIGAIKVASDWMPIERIGLIAGLTQGLGMLGAAIGAGPVGLIVSYFGWTIAMKAIGISLLIIGILIFVIVRDNPSDFKNKKVSNLPKMILIVLRDPRSWINGICAGLLYAPTAAFAELWGPYYLNVVQGISLKSAGFAVSAMFIGWAIGGPLAGYLTDRYQNSRLLIFVSACTSFLFLTIILYGKIGSSWLLSALLFCYGFANIGVAISYAIACSIVPKKCAASSVAFANMCSILIGAALQPIIGFLLKFQWNGATNLLGNPVYGVGELKLTMILLPVSLLAAACLALFLPRAGTSINV